MRKIMLLEPVKQGCKVTVLNPENLNENCFFITFFADK